MKNILELLENAARAFPDKTAVADDSSSLCYRELLQRSRAVGSALADAGNRGLPVAVCMEKSASLLAAMLGVVYSGGFYTVMDVAMPTDRMRRIFGTLKPAAVLVGRELLDKLDLSFFDGEIICYEDAAAHSEDLEALDGVRAAAIDTDPVYALFTSGSTGLPKGAVVSHRSVLAYAEWVVETFSIGPDTVFGNQTPFYFSMSVLDIFSTLKAGATLHIIPKRLFSFPVRLLEFMNEREINTIYWVPSAMTIVARSKILDYVKLPHLQKVLFAGEVMPTKQLNVWIEHMPDLFYANLYGPTEVTDICAYYVVDRPFRDDEALPIGRACNNCGLLVLTDDGRQARMDETGELCVRGSFLALGYYDNPEKTDAVFVQNPLNSHYPERIYRTGDLVKHNERGELLYICRKDFQIKHMGYRIELGEIETAASSLDKIGESVCLYDAADDKLVIVYDGRIKDEDLWRGLQDKLPRYMMPGQAVRVRQMPHNANGKIDRAYLQKNYKNLGSFSGGNKNG